MTNFVTNPGSGGSTFASDTITAVEYPLAKSAWGAAGAVNQTSVASPLPVQSISGTDVNTTGAITTSSTTVGPVTMGGFFGVTVQVSGTYAGVNFGFWASNDGTTYWPVNATRTDTSVSETTTGVLTANQTRAWDVDMGGAAYFKVISTAFTSGSAAISILQTYNESAPTVAAIAQGPSASGTASLGNPLLVGGSDGTNTRSILVDASGRATVVGVTGTSSLFVQGAAASAASIAGNPILMGGTFTTTQPTITTGQAVNLQTTNRGSLLVSLASVENTATNAGFVKITDGTTAVPVTAASTAAAANQAALNVSLSPNTGLAPTTNALFACSTGIAAALTVANIKASAGSVYGMSIANLTASTVYIQFYNTAGTPTLGTSVIWFVAVPASGTLTIPAGSIALANFATGIGIGASTTATSTGTPGTAPAVTIFYK